MNLKIEITIEALPAYLAFVEPAHTRVSSENYGCARNSLQFKMDAGDVVPNYRSFVLKPAYPVPSVGPRAPVHSPPDLLHENALRTLFISASEAFR